MPSTTRRQTLRAGVLALAGLAGCSALTDSPAEPPRLDSVRVTNYAGERRTVAVQILLDGDVVYWRDLTVRASEPESGDAPGTVHSESVAASAYPDERGRWTVRVRDRATGERAAATFAAEDFPSGCLTVAPEVGLDRGPAILHRADTSCDGGAT